MPFFCDGRPCDRGPSFGGITLEGGFAVSLINKTGSASVKGSVVEASNSDANSFILSGVSSDHSIGVVLDDGVPDGDFCRVVVSGKAQVLLKDTEAATVGYWVRTADTAGRVAMEASPNALTHWSELGHCLESQTAGTDVLAWCNLHFN